MVQQLRDAIRASGRSLNRLSVVCGVGRDRLSRFLRGERGLTLEAAEKICDVLRLHLAGDPSAADVTEGPPPGPKGGGEEGAAEEGGVRRRLSFTRGRGCLGAPRWREGPPGAGPATGGSG